MDERPYKGERAYPAAAVDLWPWWDGGRCYVRPALGPYTEAGNRILPRGQEMLAKWDAYEHPTSHVFRLAFTPTDGGNARVWVDGSYAQRLDNFQVKTAALQRLSFTFRPGAKFRLTPCAIDLSKDVLRLDFPQPEAVAKCHYVAGNSAFECESYQRRRPMDAYPNAIHRRLPAADWHLARIRFALDDDPKLEKILTVRLCCNGRNGSGGNMISDVDLDFTLGLPADVRTVGTVVWKGRSTALYEMDVKLGLGPLADLVGWKDFLDFEFLGRKRTEAEGPDRRMKPAHDRSSAFVICGVTLLKAPFNAVIRPLAASPGNVFTSDETVKRTSVTLTAWRDCAGEVVCPYDSFRYTLKRGETRRFELDLSSVKDEGLYELPIRFQDLRGKVYFTHPARMAVVSAHGRTVAPKDSTYGTWWMNWDYQNRFDVGAPLCHKAGIPKVTVTQGDKRKDMERWGLLSCGNVRILGPGFFDYETGRFKPRDGMDGETVAVEDLKRQLAATTFANHVLVWHESAEVYTDIPEELTGRPVPAATDWNRKRARYLDECVRILRKHFPDLRIQIGNTGISLGAVVCPLRGGANPEDYRGATIGNEAFGGDTPPERLTTGNIQGMALVKATAKKMLGFDVPMDGCWEATCRRTRSLGEARQAAYYVRDALIGLANGYRLTMLGGLIDCIDVRLNAAGTNAPCAFLTEYTTLTFRKPVALPGAAKGVGLWVKGDGNGGQVRFEIEDAKGRVFRTFDYGNTAYESLDGRWSASAPKAGRGVIWYNCAHERNRTVA